MTNEAACELLLAMRIALLRRAAQSSGRQCVTAPGSCLLREPLAGNDYVISEVVHCKSAAEVGVWATLDECTGRYLGPLIETSGARVIVVLGKVAEYAVRRELSLQDSQRIVGPISIGASERMLTFLPHPNARMKRSFEAVLTRGQLAELRHFVSSR